MNTQQVFAAAAVAAIGYVMMKKMEPVKAPQQSDAGPGQYTVSGDMTSGAVNQTLTAGNRIFNQQPQGGNMEFQQTQSDMLIPPNMEFQQTKSDIMIPPNMEFQQTKSDIMIPPNMEFQQTQSDILIPQIGWI